MAAIVVSSVLSIAVLLLVSGIAKVIVPDPGRNLFALLPLPEILRASWVRRYLPWAEIVIAVALVIGSGVVLWAATAGSVVVFAVFTVFVTGAVTRGVPVPCGCFGRWSRAPVSWRTVVRNVVFTAVALLAFVLVSAGGYDGPVVRLPWWGLVAVAIPALVLGVLIWSERAGGGSERFGITRGSLPGTTSGGTDARQDASPPGSAPGPSVPGPSVPESQAPAVPPRTVPRPAAGAGTSAPARPATGPAGTGSRAVRRVPEEPARTGSSAAVVRDGPMTGDASEDYDRSPIPAASALDPEGRAVPLRELARQQARCLVGLNPSITSDAHLLQRLERGRDRIEPVAVHTVVSSPADLVALEPRLRTDALIDAEGALARSFRVPATPWAVVLGTDGLLAGGPETGPAAVLALLEALEDRFED